jgi:spore germination cell wall hydrolase CwlJ-like protein
MKHLIIGLVCSLGLLITPKTITTVTPPKKPFKIISEKELTCLAKNIAYEAPDESYEGKLAVATVTMNRVKSRSFPKTVCGVVYQKNPRGCQFSWTCGPRGKLEKDIYAESRKIARAVLTKNVRLASIKNALYFHNTSVKPNWDFARPIKKIGNHIFYVVVAKKPRLTNRNS